MRCLTKKSANALLTGAKSIGALVAAKLRQSFKPLFLTHILAGRYFGGLNETDEKSMYSMVSAKAEGGADVGRIKSPGTAIAVGPGQDFLKSVCRTRRAYFPIGTAASWQHKARRAITPVAL
jgi:hypothetical protein